jgi:hypothetical protein
VIRAVDALPAWMRPLVARLEGSAAMCRHDRQLTLCGECSQEAERRMLEARENKGGAA